MEALESHEKIEHAAHGGHHGGDAGHGPSQTNRRIGLLIAVLAALLAITEAAGKSAQTAAIHNSTSAYNDWAFFQAKTIRMTTLRTAAETAKLDLMSEMPEARRAAIEKQVDAWQKTAARYDSEPETGEGRKQLSERAKHSEQAATDHMSAYHMYEYGSAVFQIAIVLASATVITGFLPLGFLSAGLGLLGSAFTLLGWLAPNLLHFGGH